MMIFGFQLYIGNSLAGALIPYFSGLILLLFLPFFSLTLLIMEWRLRKRHYAYQLFPSLLKTVFVIIACFLVSMAINWVILMDWVEAVANV